MRRLLLSLPFLAVFGAAAAETIEGKVVAVSDGDSLTIVGKDAKRRRVRLAEVDAPERKQPFGSRIPQVPRRDLPAEDRGGRDRAHR